MTYYTVHTYDSSIRRAAPPAIRLLIGCVSAPHRPAAGRSARPLTCCHKERRRWNTNSQAGNSCASLGLPPVVDRNEVSLRSSLHFLVRASGSEGKMPESRAHIQLAFMRAALLSLLLLIAGWVPRSSAAITFSAISGNASARRASLATSSECPAQTRVALYTQTNSNDTIRGNEIVLIYHECDETNSSSLHVVGRFPTGGLGSSSPIGSQNSTILYNGRLFATNTLSHDISVFDVDEESGALELIGRYPSGGQFPIGVTVHDDLLFILNSWGQGNIYGYRIRSGEADGGSDFALIPLPNSKRIIHSFPFDEPRLAINTQFGFPGLTAHESSSQVGFSPDGGWLVVVNKGADPNVGPSHEGDILVYSVDPKSGLPSIDPVHNTSTAGNIRPFSFVWLELDGEDIMLLTESDGPSASSYRFSSRTGALTPISENVGNGNRVGLCWNAYHPQSGVMFGTNAPDSTVSSYRVGRRGELVLLESVAFSYGDKFTAFPFDVSIVGDFLFTVQAGSGSVAAFQINPSNGSLALVNELIAFDGASADLIQNNGLVGLFGGTAGGLAAMRLPTSAEVEAPSSDSSTSSTGTSSSRTKHRKMLPRAAVAGFQILIIVCFAFWL